MPAAATGHAPAVAAAARPALVAGSRRPPLRHDYAQTAWVGTVRLEAAPASEAGRGIAFERFTRLAPGTSEGSGLGLSVARGLVEAMGGRLWLAEVEGPGAAFTFSLPAEHIGEP